MALGRCRHCGYRPVASDAIMCPNCGGRSPNPGLIQGAKVVWAAAIFTLVALVLLGMLTR